MIRGKNNLPEDLRKRGEFSELKRLASNLAGERVNIGSVDTFADLVKLHLEADDTKREFLKELITHTLNKLESQDTRDWDDELVLNLEGKIVRLKELLK